MYTQRFGRKLKLPSTVAIKHGLLKLMLEDHLKAQEQTAVAETVKPEMRAALPQIK